VSALGLALGGLVAAAGADDKKVEPKVGDTAPAFEARTDPDTTWKSSGRYKPKWVVTGRPIAKSIRPAESREMQSPVRPRRQD